MNHAAPARPALLARSAGLAGAATLTSRILGLVRDQVLATLFGAGNDMDAFLVAFRIPNLARDLFAEGAMSAAFVPAFSRQLTLGDKADAWHLANNALNTLLVLTAATVGLGLLFAGPLVTAFAGDYAAVPGKLALTIRLTRVMLPFLTLVTVAALLMGMLNSLDHYFVPALAPAMFNVATILCVLALAPAMASVGQPAIMAVAIGALVGGIGLVALQCQPLWREGFRYRPVLDLRDRRLQRVLLLMGPGTLGLAATQVNLFVNTLLATSQGTGAVSWLTYAFRVMYLPIGLFGISIATAVLPAAARYAALDDAKAVRETVSRGMTLMLMLNIPATFGLLALATPIVRLLFERGRFLPSDTASTAAALQFYAIGLVGYSATRIASPVFYALGRSRVPVAVEHRLDGDQRCRRRAARSGRRLSGAGARHLARRARQRRRIADAATQAPSWARRPASRQRDRESIRCIGCHGRRRGRGGTLADGIGARGSRDDADGARRGGHRGRRGFTYGHGESSAHRGIR